LLHPSRSCVFRRDGQSNVRAANNPLRSELGKAEPSGEFLESARQIVTAAGAKRAV